MVQSLFSDWVLKRERCLANVEHVVFAVMSEFRHHKTTPVGFEPTRGDPIGLAGRRLNRSAKVSSAKPKDAMIVAQHAVSQHAVGVRGNWWSQVSL